MTAVLFVGEQGDSALPYYRQKIPGAGLSRLGWSVRYAPILVERSDHRLVGWKGAPFPYEPMTKAIVVRHLLDPTAAEADSAAMFAAAANAGQAVFYDLDDDLWHLPEDNPAREHYTPDNLATLEENLRWCMGVFTTTEPLAAEIARHTPAPVYVAPNGIEVSDFTPHLPHSPLRVGWTGMTRWRIRDLEAIYEPLCEVLAGWEVELVHVGAGDIGGGRALSEWAWPCPLIEIPWRQFSNYGASLAEIDLAIVPMEDTALNRSRSPSTGLALAASGVPFIASPLPAYLELESRGLCYLATDGDDWMTLLDQLLMLASDPAWYRANATVQRQAVAKHYGPEKVARAWHGPLSEATRPGRRPARVGR